MTGAICLDILKDQWAAAMTLRWVVEDLDMFVNMSVFFFRTVLLSIQALLAAPEPDDPQVGSLKSKTEFPDLKIFPLGCCCSKTVSGEFCYL